MIPYYSFEKIGPFYTWGLFLALGFLIPIIFVLKKVEEEKISKEKIWNIFWWIMAGSIVGMRLGYVFQFPGEYLLNPLNIIRFWDGGLTFYGGLFGGIGGAAVFARKSKLDKTVFLKTADLIALYFPLGIVIGRIGCFLINDHQGAITSLPWGIAWPDGTIRHPVALYLILNGLLIFLILNILKRKFKKPGKLFFFFLLFYSLTRFFLDFTRSAGLSFSDPSLWGLNISQWVSLMVFSLLFLKMLLTDTY